ncbi:MAG: gamma-glutamyltransferase [Ilumatobacteraceae bacterium]
MREPRGVIAAGHRLTADAGADVLRAGGTAVDAAIAALAMACVCEPVLCTPGGGGFAMIRDGAGGVSLLDFFPQTPVRRESGALEPQVVRADFGPATQAFHVGPAATATPGFFSGIAALHRAAGSFPLDDLFSAAITAARAGVTVTPFQHHLATVVRPILVATPGATELFVPDGEVLPAGGRFRNPELADALAVLARDGFADSDVGRACLAQQAGRGHLTAADLDRYEVIERSPLAVRVGTTTVHLNPLPAASGTLVAHSLAQLDSSDPVAFARAGFATSEARRRSEGDLAGLAVGILRQRGTTHISIVDAAGTACAVTVSNGEGNGELVEGYGFMLNNVLGEEDVNAAGTDWPLDTRLSSMMCPTLIELADGGLVALGSGGSNRIRSAIAQVVAHLCLGGQDPRSAVEAPRLHVEGDHLDFEDRLDATTRQALREAFPQHRAWPRPDLFFGGVHLARRDADGRFDGIGDARRDGAAVVVD